MVRFVFLNDRLIESRKAKVECVTPATLYGHGVFTTLAIHDSRPFLWPNHWARLVDHAARMNVDMTNLGETKIGSALHTLIEANGAREGRARVSLLAKSEIGHWKEVGAGSQDTSLLIMTGESRILSQDGLALTISPHRINTLSPLCGIKSLNYLEHVLARDEAKSRDFDESVMLNERGEIVSATMANLFWVSKGTVHTPALACGALAGVTRECVIGLAGEVSVPVIEGVYALSDLAEADEIFLTSSGLGVAPVTTFDFRRYTVAAGSVVRRLGEAFRQMTLQVNEEP
jgi:branched-subunit amino acid aminotransferase/4-amino-4-deoxychorismate lyase